MDKSSKLCWWWAEIDSRLYSSPDCLFLARCSQVI